MINMSDLFSIWNKTVLASIGYKRIESEEEGLQTANNEVLREDIVELQSPSS